MRDNSTLLHRLQLWAIDQPEQIAFYYKTSESHWSSVSTAVHWAKVIRIAEGLKKSGLVRGDRVWIYALNSPEWVQWELGILLAGMVSIGVHPNLPDHDLRLIFTQTEPKLILVESEVFRQRLRPDGLPKELLCTFSEADEKFLTSITDDSKKLFSLGEKLLKAIDPAETQMVIFTSGTTGSPKGVKLGLQQITFVADVVSREWKLPFMDGHLFSFLPLSHVAEKIQSIGVAVTQRYPVWFNSKYERFMPELREVRPTMLLAVPRVWERFKEQVEAQKPKLLQRMMEFERVGQFAEKIYLTQAKEQMGLDRMKLAVSGAVKLAPSVAEWFLSIGIEIQEIYGMSESCGLVTLTHPKRKNFSSVGVPPAGVEVKVASDGEVWVRGQNIFNGYWNDEESTNAVKVEDGWLKTGDLGEWTPELQIIGRNREIIKLSNGRMVAPLPIENTLKEIPEISNVCLIGEGRQHLLALITLKEPVLLQYKFIPGAIEGLTVEDETLKSRIGTQIQNLITQKKITEKIGRFIVLSRDFKIEEQELTPTQKLNRNRIQQSFKHFINLQFED